MWRYRFGDIKLIIENRTISSLVFRSSHSLHTWSVIFKFNTISYNKHAMFYSNWTNTHMYLTVRFPNAALFKYLVLSVQVLFHIYANIKQAESFLSCLFIFYVNNLKHEYNHTCNFQQVMSDQRQFAC